jgi:hypothetical protein
MARPKPKPFANPLASEIFGLRRPVVETGGTFVRPAHHKASFSFIFASDTVTGNVDQYDESSGVQVGQCAACGGWGLAVNRKNGDLAVGTEVGTVTVWHVTGSNLTQYATLDLSGGASGAAAYGLAFDAQGNLYAGNWPTNAIDEFSAATIAAGGGAPTSTVGAHLLASVYFLATDGNTLIADGSDASFANDLVVKVDPKNGNTKLLQTIANANGGFPGGLAFDAHHNLIVNNQFGTLTTYAKPWTGSATSSFDYGWPYASFNAIALDAAQAQIWAGNIFFQTVSGNNYAFTDVQSSSYPLGALGAATSPAYQDEEYAGVALDPQTRN